MIAMLICSVLLCQPVQLLRPAPTDAELLERAQKILRQINPNARLPESVVTNMTAPAPAVPSGLARPADYDIRFNANSNNVVRTLAP